MLLAFVRKRIFNEWRQLFPMVRKISGSFEVFNPSRGANMRWHQDGHTPGTFIAHLALLDDQSQVSGSMNWFEVALPSRSAHPPAGEEEGEQVGQAEVDEEMQYAVKMHPDEESIARITRNNFIAFDFESAASQRLIVFEDDRCYHRTPLTAHAIREIQQRQRRPIARFVFYAVRESDADYEASHSTEDTAIDDAGKVPTTMSCSLPKGLLDALEAYMAQGCGAKALMTMDEATEAYISGDDDLIRWLTSSYCVEQPD